MKTPETILLRPLITEKMLAQQESRNTYGFEVACDSNKPEIKRAVQQKFKVVVEQIRTVNVKGKSKRQNTRRGMTTGFRRDWKKALVTLRKGDTIDFFGTAKAS
jgi:large subunit ribosomal protein L23